MPITLDDLRRFAVARSLFTPTTLQRALDRLGFVQADPIRAPARAQDLMLRHRVKNYCAGDLERSYEKLEIEEDFFVVYGFVTKGVYALMHPRPDRGVFSDSGRWWSPKRKKQAQLLLEFVQERGVVHPREVDQHFAHGSVKNYWGGSSSATTHMLAAMHYRGMLRVAKRVAGIRLYAVPLTGIEAVDAAERQSRLDALVDVAAGIYAPLPAARLPALIHRLRYAAPQWKTELRRAVDRAKGRLAHERVDGVEWYWPAGEKAVHHAAPDVVRLLAPFDPVVWDRYRFERLWGWEYRFEAYTPIPKRKLGYYAMPLLWRDQVIGWGNLAVKDGALESSFGYVASEPPRDRAFQRELEAEVARVRAFLGLVTALHARAPAPPKRPAQTGRR